MPGAPHAIFDRKEGDHAGTSSTTKYAVTHSNNYPMCAHKHVDSILLHPFQ